MVRKNADNGIEDGRMMTESGICNKCFYYKRCEKEGTLWGSSDEDMTDNGCDYFMYIDQAGLEMGNDPYDQTQRYAVRREMNARLDEEEYWS